MASEGHTPGPWIAERYSVKLSCSSHAWAVAECHHGLGYDDHEALANAHLISAAPDLLEALQMLVADFADYPASERPCAAFDKARSAISKATGQ